MNLAENPKDDSRKESLSRFLISFRDGSDIFKQHWLRCHWQVDYPKCLPNSA